MTYKYTFSNNEKLENENPLEILKEVLNERIGYFIRDIKEREEGLIEIHRSSNKGYWSVADDPYWCSLDGKKEGLLIALRVVKDLLTDKEFIEF